MAWQKGKPRPAGAGRQKGSPNKTTVALKEMILGALDDVGGQKYLKTQAAQNPTAFLARIGEVPPTTLTSDPNAPVVFEIKRTIIDSNS